MALKQINKQYTNTDNIVKTYKIGDRYFVAFKGGIEIELKGNTASDEYNKLSAYFDKTRTNEFVNKDIIYKTYQVGDSPNYKYYLEFTNGQKIEIESAEYNAIIADSGESPIDPQSLNASIGASRGLSKDILQSTGKFDIHIDMTHATQAGMIFKSVADTELGGYKGDWVEDSGGEAGVSDTFKSETLVSGSAVDFAELGSDNQWHLSGFTVCDSSLQIPYSAGAEEQPSLIVPGLSSIRKDATGGSIELFKQLTQAQYDALTTKNADTLYIIVG